MNRFTRLFLLQGFIFLTLGSVLVEAALTLEDCQKCHDREYQQITSSGKSHKEKVTCLECHEKHRPKVANNVPQCIECHGRTPHQGMVDCSSCHARKNNCMVCHMAHQPLVWPPGEAAPLHCKVCHPVAAELQNKSTSKHHTLSCTYCHREHRNIQQCSACHGLPHPAGTHKMFPQCAVCHNVAHDLNPK